MAAVGEASQRVGPLSENLLTSYWNTSSPVRPCLTRKVSLGRIIGMQPEDHQDQDCVAPTSSETSLDSTIVLLLFACELQTSGESLIGPKA